MRLSAPAMRRAAWLAIVCHVLVASGLPLPVGVPGVPSLPLRASMQEHAIGAGSAGKDRSRPFPCMDRPCGCATAEQCFANCCCHTPAERLAWAKAHRVEPAVLAALEKRVAVTAASAAGCCAASHGNSARHPAAAEPAVELDAPDVCSAYRSLAAAPPAPTVDDVPVASAPQTVILRDMLACGGIVTAWLACGAALPPPRVEPPAHDAFAGCVAVRDAVAPSAGADLSTPPPRAA